MDKNIDITGVNKAKILAALYNKSQPLGMGFLQAEPWDMTEVEAQEILDAGHTYFDYLKGRVMKIDLSKDDLRVGLYDRDNGDGAAYQAVKELLIA